MKFLDESRGFGISVDVQPVTLVDKFGIPPFSIMDARQGYWQERKKLWLTLGVQSEVGRGEHLAYRQQFINEWMINNPARGTKKEKRKTVSGCLGKSFLTIHPYDNYDQKDGTVSTTGTSIFDPVLCELAYRWFCVKGGNVLDPFAGGSIRGIVASLLNIEYTGVDLRGIQIEANKPQWERISKRKFAKDKPVPKWICGDSRNIDKLAPGEYDFIFSCPPYADLEKYSDDPADISNMEYNDFLDALEEIILKSCKMLRPNRFACFVVSDMRDENGFYRTFPTHVTEAFEDAGLTLWNEAILITSVGSLPMRASRPFKVSRKLGRAHQNILVFYNGDPYKISEIFGSSI